MTVGEAIRDATARLDTDWARDEVEMLMAHALGVTRSAMLLGRMRDAAPTDFAALIERRRAHEPVAHIMGETEFYGRRFEVTPDTLIPRGDSETVVRAALGAKPNARRVVDLGTGSGCLLLTLLAELPNASGTGLERSPGALAVAQRNAASLNLAARTELREGDWTSAGWSDGLGPYDLVVANPPYIEDDADLDASVRDFEPAGALFAGAEGLDDYRILMPQLAALLAPGGIAVFEIGYDQADAVTALGAANGFASELHRDLAGRPRALVLWEKGLANVR